MCRCEDVRLQGLHPRRIGSEVAYAGNVVPERERPAPHALEPVMRLRDALPGEVNVALIAADQPYPEGAPQDIAGSDPGSCK